MSLAKCMKFGARAEVVHNMKGFKRLPTQVNPYKLKEGTITHCVSGGADSVGASKSSDGMSCGFVANRH